MGTEKGIAEFEADDVHSMLPSFVTASAFVDGDGGYEADAHEVGDYSGKHLFSHCLTVAGMLHIFSNASQDLYKIMSTWSSLYDSLKILEPLVTNRDRMQKYLYTCFAGTPHSKVLFRGVANRLYDKRWGEVYKFCSWLQPRLPISRDTWAPARYEVLGNPLALLVKC